MFSQTMFSLSRSAPWSLLVPWTSYLITVALLVVCFSFDVTAKIGKYAHTLSQTCSHTHSHTHTQSYPHICTYA